MLINSVFLQASYATVCEKMFPDVMFNVALSQLHIVPSSTITGGKL